jgi:hypothetical protein
LGPVEQSIIVATTHLQNMSKAPASINHQLGLLPGLTLGTDLSDGAVWLQSISLHATGMW